VVFQAALAAWTALTGHGKTARVQCLASTKGRKKGQLLFWKQLLTNDCGSGTLILARLGPLTTSMFWTNQLFLTIELQGLDGSFF
jgi:hypothetical protein